MFKFGFSVPYCEVTRFKQASLTSQSINDKIKQISTENSFTQFIADNVDHNIDNLDGRGTFHGMGIIASAVSKSQSFSKELKIKRPDKLLKVEELTSKGTEVHTTSYEEIDLVFNEMIL